MQCLKIFYFILDMEEELEEEYIAEDWDTVTKWTYKATRRIQQNILQELQTMVGGAQTLPETAAKDLVMDF